MSVPSPVAAKAALLGAFALVLTGIRPSVAFSEDTEDSGTARAVVLFGAKDSYRVAADAVGATLRGGGHRCTLIELPEDQEESARDQVLQQLIDEEPTIIAAGGTAAATFALQTVPSIPIVFFMVPNALDAPFVSDEFPRRHRIAGVTSDVSPAEQALWMSQICPDVAAVAVLHSPRSRRTAEALKAATLKYGIRCFLVDADKSAFPKAIEDLDNIRCDGALMVPDSQVYNSPCVQRLLLWGVRQKKIVWGFSESIVKAGALAAQYPDSDAIGRQTAGLVQRVISGARPVDIGLVYPDHVERAVNERTAAMIGVLFNDRHVGEATVRYGGDQ